FAASITDALPGSVTPGSSQGIPYTRRAQTSSGSVFGEDITWSAAGPQHGTATLTNAVEWYAVCAVFHQLPTTPPVPPSTPFGLLTDHSASSEPLTLTTPAASPEFVQGVGASPGTRLTSLKLTLSEPVLAGDLLVGWFGQYNASGQVRVSDNVNGSWTRSVS